MRNSMFPQGEGQPLAIARRESNVVRILVDNSAKGSFTANEVSAKVSHHEFEDTGDVSQNELDDV